MRDKDVSSGTDDDASISSSSTSMDEKISEYDAASPLARVTYSFVDALIRKGCQSSLQQEDLYQVSQQKPNSNCQPYLSWF